MSCLTEGKHKLVSLKHDRTRYIWPSCWPRQCGNMSLSEHLADAVLHHTRKHLAAESANTPSSGELVGPLLLCIAVAKEKVRDAVENATEVRLRIGETNRVR